MKGLGRSVHRNHNFHIPTKKAHPRKKSAYGILKFYVPMIIGKNPESVGIWDLKMLYAENTLKSGKTVGTYNLGNVCAEREEAARSNERIEGKLLGQIDA